MLKTTIILKIILELDLYFNKEYGLVPIFHINQLLQFPSLILFGIFILANTTVRADQISETAFCFITLQMPTAHMDVP